MKGNRRAAVALLTIAGVIGSVATYKVAAIVVFGVRHTNISYYLDERLSQEIKQKIAAYVECNTTMRPQALLANLQSVFDCIDTIEFKCGPSGAQMSVRAHDMSALLNNHYLVTVSGNLIEKEQYDPMVIDTLKHLEVYALSSKQLPKLVQAWIDRMPFSLFNMFNVTWIDENSIELQYAQDAQLIIRCAHEQLIEELLVDACVAKKDEFIKSCLMKSNDHVIADVRFDQQIILSKK